MSTCFRVKDIGGGNFQRVQSTGNRRDMDLPGHSTLQQGSFGRREAGELSTPQCGRTISWYNGQSCGNVDKSYPDKVCQISQPTF